MVAVAFKRKFRVRHYECDAYGHLNNVNYVRYMQEAALDASAAVGWDAARYEALGQHWLIRETDITYLAPLFYNDPVEITTYVSDFRRVQSRRAYEFRHADSGADIATGSTNWVYLDRATQRPVAIPEAMKQDFAPEGLPATQLDHFPSLAPHPEEVFTIRKRVEWRDIDTVGHANNAAYFAYCEDAATQVGKHFGWPMQRITAAGFAIVLRRFRIQYRLPAFLDDEIDVRCWLSDGKRISALRHYTLTRVSDGAELARAQALWVCFDLEKQRPMRFPPQFIAAFQTNISE